MTLLLVAALVGACSSDDGDDAAATTAPATTDETTEGGGGGGDDEEFCALLEDSATTGDDIDLDTPEGLEAFQQLADAAPADLEEPMQVIAEAIEKISGLDEDDPESFGVFFEVFFDPEVLGAFEAVERWGVEHCDLPDDFLEADDDGADLDLDLDADDDDDDDDLETSDVREYLESTYGEVPPYDDIVGFTIFNGDVSVAFVTDVSPDDAVTVCEAVSEYVYDVAGHSESRITVTASDGTVRAERDGRAGSCAPA